MRHAVCLAAVVLSVQLQAQENLPGRLRRVGLVRDAGTLHLATGTWTRKVSGANVGSDTIYDNTCGAQYYSPFSGDSYVDEGRLPSPTSPINLSSRPGCATSYRIDGFKVGYCTDRVDPGTFTFRFFETYTACASVIGRPPDGTIALSSLPGAPLNGVSTCWAVTIDLDAPPAGSNLSFSLAADGDGAYVGSSSQNLFGWSISSSLPAGDGARTGLFLAADINVCNFYDGTRWDAPVDYTEDGNGMGTLDQFRIEGGTTTPGCYYFSGGPYASLYLELYADACPAVSSGLEFCSGDGAATPCPCGNASPAGESAGCLNSLGQGAALRADGQPRLTNDSLALHVARIPPGVSALFFQGTNRTNGGLGSVFGDGLRCAGGSVTRLRTISALSGGYASIPEASDPSLSTLGQVSAPGVRTYQAWYRNSASFCTTATFNLSNGWEAIWAP